MVLSVCTQSKLVEFLDKPNKELVEENNVSFMTSSSVVCTRPKALYTRANMSAENVSAVPFSADMPARRFLYDGCTHHHTEMRDNPHGQTAR